jgi:23S rRNA pseudouridine2605 synthase
MTAAADVAGERVAKLIARAGLCSRRDAEAWIGARRVAVDGSVLDSPAVRVRPGQRVTVDGKPLPAPEATRLFRYHKPQGVVTSTRDPGDRPTIYDTLPEGLPRLMPVGRLDIGSEGLLLLTNDGELKRRLELPATGWLRRYRARAFGTVDDRQLKALAQGVTVDGVTYGPIQAKLDRTQGGNAWLTLSLREGKNREVRRVLEHVGLKVNRLIRVAYGPFQLGHLAKRAVEEVPPKVLREQVGGPAAGSPRRPRPAPAAPAPAAGAE